MRLERLVEAGRAFVGGGAGAGTCSVCDGMSLFLVTRENRREGVLCVRCRSAPRHRALMRVLNNEAPGWAQLAVYEAGESWPVSRQLSERCSRFVTSNYLPDVVWGDSSGGVRSENLECLTFADESFDVVVTQEVLEHVFHTNAAFAQIARVLRPGGVHVFTVPYDPERPSAVRARRSGTSVTHLEPPAYHGDPLDPSGVLVVTDWGRDLPDAVERASGLKTYPVHVPDPSGKLPAPIVVFVSRKRSR